LNSEGGLQFLVNASGIVFNDLSQRMMEESDILFQFAQAEEQTLVSQTKRDQRSGGDETFA
jgi:hypothetical protein